MTTQQILDTLSYFSNFNFPLTKDELWRYLCVVGDDRRVVPFDQFDKTLSDLLSTRALKTDGLYYSLFDSVNLVNRQEREKISLQKIEQARQIFKKISWWPWLQGVLVTGSTAAMNAVTESDIDVLIITSKDALWLTRFFVVIYLKLARVYRNIICPNIWLTDETLEWGRHDLPTAVDAVLTKPLIDKNNSYEEFLIKNSWVKQYLPNVKIPTVDSVGRADTSVRPYRTGILALVNNFFFISQKIFMKAKVTSEEVTLNKAHFKKVDNHARSHPHIAHPTA